RTCGCPGDRCAQPCRRGRGRSAGKAIARSADSQLSGVANLYAGLTESAPWRFAAAYAMWLAERGGRPKPAAMFGLKGLTQARKPKVTLDRIPSGIILRLEFSGGNLILPSALWTVPADFALRRRATDSLL